MTPERHDRTFDPAVVLAMLATFAVVVPSRRLLGDVAIIAVRTLRRGRASVP